MEDLCTWGASRLQNLRLKAQGLGLARRVLERCGADYFFQDLLNESW